MRGRGGGGSNNNNNNNNNRKGPNPLTRSYESNGPDVKIRGTAQQVADKYTTLARDAQSSGDRVMAENYLQHAEHYNRIIAAAMAQQQQFQQQRESQDDFDGEDDDRPERETRQNGETQPQFHANGFGPQPVIDDQPAGNGFEASANDAAAAPEQQAAEGSPAAGEEGEAPRRARRPRRPMRARQTAEEGDASAEAETPQTPEAAE